jgi:spermidine synthase
VLLLGLGPGVVDRRLSGEGLSVDAVEIDAEVLAVAREYFDYAGDAVVDDGRRYIQRTEGTWDLIIVDAFAGGSPPWQLYTREAFELYARHLDPGGAVILNFVGSHLDPRQRDALEAVVSTARSVFQTVHTYPDPWEPDDYPTRNIFIAATDNRRSPPLAEGSPRLADSLSEAIARSRPVEVAQGRVLTDESAPLEPLVRHTTEILRNRVREFLPVAVLLH